MQFELTKEYIETLRDAIERNAETSLIAFVSELHPADLAEVMEELEAGEALVLYKVLDADRASDVLTHFEDDRLKEFLGQLTSKEIAEDLFIAKTTVDTHRKNMIRKLDLSSGSELIKYAVDKKYQF